MRDPEYDGPGTYRVRVDYVGSAYVDVQALSRSDAEERALELEAEPGELEAENARTLYAVSNAISAETEFIEDRELLTGLEEAVFCLTGHIPPEAIRRIDELKRLEEAAA